jgi:predicted peptidase
MRLAGIGRGVAHFLRAIPALVSSRQGIMPYCVAAVAPLNGIAAIGVWESTRQKTMDWIGGTAEGLHYEILLPEHYSVMQRYPVLLYLHQYDMGRNRKNLINQMDALFGFAEFRTLDQTKDPSANFGGKRSGRSWQNATIAVLEQVKARYSIDPTRIYVTGNSLDGMETWDVL